MRIGRSRYRRSWVTILVAALNAGWLLVPAPALGGVDAVDPYIDALAEAANTPILHWADCEDGFQCATAEVPLDYNRAHDEQIELAVIKLPAADPVRRIGTLFVNFGGPGPSGVDRLRERARWPWLFSDELRSRFDIVSWDPRAVSRSAAARCFSSAAEQEQFLASFPEIPSDIGAEPNFFDRSKEFADRCEQNAGPILDHASTVNTARDLELLRRAVGDPKLTYHGISYGTQLAAIYANLFPSRVRAMALDGSLDFEGNINGHDSQGTTLPIDTRQDVAGGIAASFDAFLRDCSAAGPRCAFSTGDPKFKWTVLAERARWSPIMMDGQLWTYSAIVGAAGDLSEPSAYPDLAVLLQKLFDAGISVPKLVSLAAGGEPYLANRTEAYHAIQCSDSIVPTDPAAYTRAGVVEDLRVPYFGRASVFDMTICAFWQGHDADRYTGPWNRSTAAPILVLNSRFDPATPLHGAYTGAAELNRAQVVVIEGVGHSTMYVPSTCAERVKREYLFTGELPPAGTTCSRDKSPFD
ncbi:alpha/beta hydrolase [Nocardia sp. NPDC049526]|uniref:alpha/beta hydrolase n=1 Tax=Nocardia sp. NPDC049526 TaxID=3364316 RepID=UPI0037B7502F